MYQFNIILYLINILLYFNIIYTIIKKFIKIAYKFYFLFDNKF